MSYAATTTLAPDMTSDATFRLWGSGISSKLNSMGVVQTGDTGQINWTTVTRPIATNTSAGYEIWRFADTLQSSVPVYIRIEYGSAASTSIPGLWITIGSGSDGAGNLTGRVNVRNQITINTSNVIPQTCVFSGDTNRIGVGLFTSAASTAMAFFIERTKNTDGSNSSLGIFYSAYSNVGNAFTQFIPGATPVLVGVANSNLQPPVGATSGAFGSDTAVYPALYGHGGTYLNAGMSHVGYFNSDQTVDTTFTITMYGTTHTFYALGNKNFIATAGRGATILSIAMRYE